MTAVLTTDCQAERHVKACVYVCIGTKFWLLRSSYIATVCDSYRVLCALILWRMILVPTPMNCHPSDHNSCSCRPYEWPFWFGFLVPFVIIYIFNWIMFAIIMISLCRHSVKTPGDKDKKSMVARYLLIAMMLSLLFGLGWAFGLIGTSSLPAGVSIPAQYIFSIFIGFQGVLLFVLHAIRSPDSREEWKRGWYTITGRADKYRVICPPSIIATGTSSRSKHPISENIMLQQPAVLAQVSPSS